MKVAMVGLRAPWGAEGGVEAYVGELAPRLAARGCAVTIYCRGRYNPLGSGVHNGVRLVDGPAIYSRHLEAISHTALATPRALSADVVHIHATGPALLSWLPRLAGRAAVVTLHGLDWQREKWGLGAKIVLRAGAWSAARFPHRLTAVAGHLQEHFREAYGAESVVIPPGVSPIAPVPLAESGIPGLEPGRYLLFVGRLVPEKGLEALFAAYARATIPLPLVVAGGAAHMADYAAKLRRLAPPGVILAGPRLGRARDALLTHARALALPSTLEGLPLVALEALSAGCPVLLSDIPPHREILAGSGGGWLVPAGGWPGALRQAAAAPAAELQRRGKAGREHVRAAYSWDANAERHLELYREASLLAGRAL